MGEIINHYELLSPFQSKNAGFSRWTFAVKDGKEYFLKEFLDPVYPSDLSISEDLRSRRIYDCEIYEEKQRKLYFAVNKASHGNIVRIAEFFRCDNHYYAAMERIKGEKVVMTELPFETRFLVCKTIAYEMMFLHRKHIVHADVKESNIIIKSTSTGKLAGKIIDFDASFFEDDPPSSGDEFVGDQVYLAPEACQFICEEPVELTCKIDVFSLGLLFHRYLTGKLPDFDTNEYDYAFEAVLDGQKLKTDNSLSPELQKLIQGMLECDPEKRLSMSEVYSVLDDMEPYRTVRKETDAERKCPQCGNIVGATDKFCIDCGYKLPESEKICPECGNFVAESDQFCIYCGYNFPPAKAKYDKENPWLKTAGDL